MQINLRLAPQAGCSIMVVYAVWDREARVRFPAPRLSLKDYEIRRELCFLFTQ